MAEEKEDYFELIVELFQKYDEDNSKTISADELAGLVYDLGVYMTPVEIEGLMKQLDSDGSGEIEFDEFHRWWQTTDSFEKLSKAKTDALQTAVELFREADTDNSGTIDRKEWLVIFKRLFDKTKLSVEDRKLARAQMKLADTDGDGQISLDEYIDWLIELGVIA
eukprot:CAMPEP_0177663204 /NCGR_PEP_ID=MMETSP0447-20121125/19782_1 /TAXON_ID=0 /ORGANISM="Stygamoeba regulata, Strain BSH-02190019" /LENGTH=164 /DNA_ID=CAMNT_0019168987 /DNA_START=9 /DNA_END=503 /DNA_ORIENTATION=-